MQEYEWRGWVQLRRPDESSLGEAKAQLSARPEADGRLGWRGVLRAGTTSTSTSWPADEPVVLHCPDGRDLTVYLEPAVVERGPVLLQVAHVRMPTPTRRNSSGCSREERSRSSMYGTMTDSDIDALLRRHRYGRLGFTLNGEVYIIPINYGYDGQHLYGQAPRGGREQLPGGTKLAGIRQNPHVAFQVDEIVDPTHWHSVLLQGRAHELTDRQERQAAVAQIGRQAGGGERSEVTWALDIDHLALFRIDVLQEHGRFEQREAYGLRPGRIGPLPPAAAPLHSA